MDLVKDPSTLGSLTDEPDKSRNAEFGGNMVTRSVSEGRNRIPRSRFGLLLSGVS